MKLSKIVKRVEEIRDQASKFPISHQTCVLMENELWAEVLHDFAMGKGSEAKAHAALETQAIQFSRAGG